MSAKIKYNNLLIGGLRYMFILQTNGKQCKNNGCNLIFTVLRLSVKNLKMKIIRKCKTINLEEKNGIERVVRQFLSVE